MGLSLLGGTVSWAGIVLATSAMAQSLPSGPPPVGVVTVQRQPMTDSYEFNGRIQAINSVNIVARVSAFLEQKLFTEGADVKKGDLLYTLERPPYQAAVDVRKAAIAQAQAQLENDNIDLWRAQSLARTQAGTQQAADTALATQRSAEAQLGMNKAQLEIAQIDLGYTEIRSPIDGRIGRTSVTIGNVVGPGFRYLDHSAQSGSGVRGLFGSDASRHRVARGVCREGRIRCGEEIRVRLPDGRVYGETGKLDFVNNTIAQDTDTFTFRGVIPKSVPGSGDEREA